MKQNTIYLCMVLSSLTAYATVNTSDGSAASYKNLETGEEIVPRIETRNGKDYYFWPNFSDTQNWKNQVTQDRTTHPDAQWWPEAGLGLFMHWGIVSEFGPTGEAWAGRWTQRRADSGRFYPQEQIWGAAETFNPTKYDADKWMAAAAKAGFRYTVLTTKHHDGYALWDSDYSVFGVRQYLDGRDLVKPFVEACRKNDLKVGFYYSGWDWYYERDTMNFGFDANQPVNYKGEFVGALPKRTDSFWQTYDEYNHAQVTELIEKYDPDIWWQDGGYRMTLPEIRKLRPGIVCNNRANSGGDHATPEGFHMADPQYVKTPIVQNGWWWEVNSIIQGGSWHYDAKQGENIYPSDRVLIELARARCMGGNFLANIGPRPNGEFQDEVYRLFDDMAEWMKTNKESVFSINGGGPWPEQCNVPITAKDRTWYFHSQKQDAAKDNPVILSECPVRPVSMKLLRTGDSIPFEYKGGTLTYSIPENLKAINVTDVVKVVFGADFDPEPYTFKHW